MKIPGFISDNSIFVRLIATFFIILIPIYFMGISIYNWGVDSVQQKVIGEMKVQLDFFIKRFEDDIQRIRLLQFDMLNDEDLRKLSTFSGSMSEYEISASVNRISQRLNAIKSSSGYIDDVTAFPVNYGKKISASGKVDLCDADSLGWITDQHSESIPDVYINGKRLYLEAWTPSYETENYCLWLSEIEVGLSGEEISKALRQFDIYDSGGCFLVVAGSSIIAANTDDTVIAAEIEDGLILRDLPDQSAYSFMQLGEEEYIILASYSENLDIHIVRYFPEGHVTNQIKQYNTRFWLFSVLAVIVIVIFSLFTYRFIQRPLLQLVKAFKKLEKGDLELSITHKRHDEFGYLYRSFNKMTSKLGELIDQVYKQKILAQNAELKQLQSQINPHFLYNSFFILYRMAKADDIDNIISFAQRLGTYFQYITRNASDEVTLQKETSHAKIYSDIQSIRFYNRIKVDFGELPDQCKDIMVPRLILQPVIENAFEHGLEQKEKDGLLQIRFIQHENFISIYVEDNGDDFGTEDLEMMREKLGNSSKGTEHTGLVNIHKRLQLKFGPGSGVSAERSRLGGLAVCLNIPFKEDDNNV